ncbi:hypothetical protein DMENIID0001_073910 [Sergentomyia squamirostris]
MTAEAGKLRDKKALEEWREKVNFDYLRYLMDPDASIITPEFDDQEKVYSQINKYLEREGKDPFEESMNILMDAELVY